MKVDPQEVLAKIDVDELVKVALDLGNIDSPTGREGPVADYVHNWLRRLGFDARKVGLFPDRPNVIATLPGSGRGRSLCFNSHMDTAVHQEEWWASRRAGDPGEGVLREVLLGEIVALQPVLLRRNLQVVQSDVLRSRQEDDLMRPRTQVRIDTGKAAFAAAPGRAGIEILPLFRDAREEVRLERWAPQAEVALTATGGLELLVLEGGFDREGEPLTAQSWLRLPDGAVLRGKAGAQGGKLWLKTGHLIHVRPVAAGC